MQIGDANADGITIPDERQLFAIGPPRDEFALQDHVTSFHVNLIKNPD